jgi:N-methylhydantoinase A
VVGVLPKPREQRIDAGTARPPGDASRGNRLVYFADLGFVETPTYDRAKLVASNTIKGPALVEEYASTTVVHPGDVLEVDGIGNLVIAIGGDRP